MAGDPPESGTSPLREAVENAGWSWPLPDDALVLVADESMRYLEASAAACDLLGYGKEELIERMHVPDVVVEDDADLRYRAMVWTGRQQGRVTLICRDGRQLRSDYEARKSSLGGLTCWVSLLSPASGPPRS